MGSVVHTPMLLGYAFILLCLCGCDSDESTDVTDSGADGDAIILPVTITGPITGGNGKPFSTSVVDLGAHDYGESEYFYEGDATAYALEGEMTLDGKWTLQEHSTEHYKSRMIVRRPLDSADFNGTVVLEWLNVSGGVDGDPGFMYNWQEIVREGYAWVGVTAQATGIEGGGLALVPGEALLLKEYDAERYGSLSHPGDAYSFDMYTQAAQIVAGAGEVDVLEGLEPARLIAYGQSQSAMRLVSYVNGVHPRVKVLDGFFIHSRSSGGAMFTNDAPLPIGGAPVFIRDDTQEPVFQFQTETDVFGDFFGYLDARQPDSDTLRSWEVAGTSHADAYIMNIGGEASSDAIACDGVNEGPHEFVVKAALHALNLWMSDGTEPAMGDLLMTDDMGEALTDMHGNILGGIRTPHVDVPIALLSGLPPKGSTDFLCTLFGQTLPFTPEQLLELYPTHEDYVMRVEDAAAMSREATFVLDPEATRLVDEAESAPVPR